MSYDVSLYTVDAESGQVVAVDSLEASHTSNTGGMIEEAAGKPFRDWDGLRGSEVAALCVRAIRELDFMPDYYRRHEPDNGWGTLESTRKFLSTIRDECTLAPTALLRVST